jgi:ABC-2 type transport system permease protein
MKRQQPEPKRWTLFARTVIARAYPRLVGGQRERLWMFFDIVLPLIGLSAYVFVYRAIGAPETFVGFVLLGGAMSAFWLNVLWSMANQLYMEKEMGNLGLYIASPSSMMAILLGMALGGMVNTTLRALIIIVLGSWFFDVRYDVVSVPMLVAVFGVALFALYGLGMMFASIFLLWGREAWHLVNLLQEPIYLLSGTNFPVSIFPRFLAILASAVPLTLGMDAMRQVLFRAPKLFDVWVEVAVLAGLAVVFLLAAHRCLRYLERRAKEEGKLTVRWQ